MHPCLCSLLGPPIRPPCLATASPLFLAAHQIWCLPTDQEEQLGGRQGIGLPVWSSDKLLLMCFWGLQAREAGEDVDLGGFHIPKGTRVWLNVRGMHLDEQHFPDPLVGRSCCCCSTCMIKASGSFLGRSFHAGRRGILRRVPGLLTHPATISSSFQLGAGSCCVPHRTPMCVGMASMAALMALLTLENHPLQVFKPERHMSGHPLGPESRHPTAFAPFGVGPRKCIGWRFAMEEALLTLVMLHQKFYFTLDAAHHPPGSQLQYLSAITLMPRGGIWLQAHARGSPTSKAAS